MIRPGQRLALYMEGAFEDNTGKMGLGVLRYSPHPVVCALDTRHAGEDVGDLAPAVGRSCPIVASLAEARGLGTDVLILGIAPPGGLIPASWYPVLEAAVRQGFSIVNGLHDHLGPRFPDLAPGQYVWDVRTEPPGLNVATGRARELANRRVLCIGTDMSVGKMTAGLELYKSARSQDLQTEFVATGQTGMTIMGRGVPLDAVRLDYAAGSIEGEVMKAAAAELVIVEGQGSLLHPASSATLPLIRGSVPTHFLMVHRAGMTHLPRHPWVQVPPLREFAALYEDVATAGGNYPRPVTFAVALNTGHLSAEEAERACRETEAETGWVTVDPIRHGADRLLDALLRA